MPPLLLLRICVGGVLCLTPLSLYIYWLARANKQRNPIAVSGQWDFVGLLAGLFGFLFCTGFLLGIAFDESGYFQRGDFTEQAARSEWLRPVRFATVSTYLILLAAAISFGLRQRKHSIAVYNIDESTAQAVVRELNSGFSEGGVKVVFFSAMRHATFRLPDAFAESLSSQLRAMLAHVPAARSHPAVAWISAVLTCSLVTAVCCMALLVASPFLR